MAESRGARLEARLLKQEVTLTALREQVERMEAALRGLVRQQVEPRPIDVEAHPALKPAMISAATMTDIVARVALIYGLSVDELRGKGREIRVSHPRQEAMLMMHEAGYSMPRIGRFFKRDHTTILHGIRAARTRANSVNSPVDNAISCAPLLQSGGENA